MVGIIREIVRFQDRHEGKYSSPTPPACLGNNSVGEAWRAVGNQVLREALVGNIEEARRAEAAFNDYSPYSHGYYGHSSQELLALALAFAGETAKPYSFVEESLQAN